MPTKAAEIKQFCVPRFVNHGVMLAVLSVSETIYPTILHEGETYP